MKDILLNLRTLRTSLERSHVLPVTRGNALFRYVQLCLHHVRLTIPGLMLIMKRYDKDPILDYSAGLQMRPLMTDILSIEYLKSEIKTIQDFEAMEVFIETVAKSYLYDGIDKWLKHAALDEQKGAAPKEHIAAFRDIIKHEFPEYFAGEQLDPQALKKHRKNVKAKQATALYEAIKSEDPNYTIVLGKVYFLFDYYSKFEHLSEFTMKITNNNHPKKIQLIEEATVHLLRHVQQLYALVRHEHPQFQKELSVITRRITRTLRTVA